MSVPPGSMSGHGGCLVCFRSLRMSGLHWSRGVPAFSVGFDGREGDCRWGGGSSSETIFCVWQCSKEIDQSVKIRNVYLELVHCCC